MARLPVEPQGDGNADKPTEQALVRKMGSVHGVNQRRKYQ
jgi:hypothetical protein